MSVNSLRVVSECATTVATSVPERRDLADVEVIDALCDLSVSIQVHAAAVCAGCRSSVGVELDPVLQRGRLCGSVNLTLGIGGASWLRSLWLPKPYQDFLPSSPRTAYGTVTVLLQPAAELRIQVVS